MKALANAMIKMDANFNENRPPTNPKTEGGIVCKTPTHNLGYILKELEEIMILGSVYGHNILPENLKKILEK